MSVSVTSWCSTERDGRIELAFGMDASFDKTVLNKKKFWHLQKTRVGPTYLLNFVRNCGLKNSAMCSVSKRVINFADEGGRSEREKLDRRRSTKLTMRRSTVAS